MLDVLPTVSEIVQHLDTYLEKKHPAFFGPQATHPVLPLKRHKILHDNLWGTNKFTWQELALIDSPIFQRLRDIHQTGLAFQVYMCAHHTRFEHSLGVASIASRVFDQVLERQADSINDIANAIDRDRNSHETISSFKRELRIAALLHDTGHSLFSHTSERVFGKLSLLKSATEELSDFLGKEKGTGEVISFCFALTESIKKLIERAGKMVLGNAMFEEHSIDFNNVALILVGRSNHPFTQFLGDIISSGFDADKLDYLLRDATNAGLPLRYDIERYLFSVQLEKDVLVDGEDNLKRLYAECNKSMVNRNEPREHLKFPFYDTYRLRIPRKAMNTIEQIVICKLMLFSYIYHHRKVRAAEGMLQRMLGKMVDQWHSQGEDDKRILERFLDIGDSSLCGDLRTEAKLADVEGYLYRLINRLLPREIYGLSGADVSHAEKLQVLDFLTDLQDRKKRWKRVNELETEIGKELLKIDDSLGKTAQEALFKSGVWVDVPNPPKFEDVDELVLRKGRSYHGIPLIKVFPIGEWTQAYTHYRYQVRIFAFSEYIDIVDQASKSAMQRVIKIAGSDFYDKIRRDRAFDQ